MKAYYYLIITLFALSIISCTKEDFNEEIQAIDKDLIESPGGQSRIDKDKIESPGGQS